MLTGKMLLAFMAPLSLTLVFVKISFVLRLVAFTALFKLVLFIHHDLQEHV